MPFFSVLIVNYNGAGWIGRALESLKAQTFQDFEVILVDNASSDGSLAEARSASRSDWTLIASDENLGFAKGNNVAATHAKGRWLALLNPDAQAHPDWLEHVADGIRRHPGSTMFACTQFATEDPTLLDGAGDAFLGFGIPWRGGFRRSASELPSEGQCFSPCGASAIYKKSVFDDAEGFDTRFFCYCEDVDLGFRLRLAGETCVFLPAAAVDHAGSAIAGRTSDFALFHGSRNRLWTYVKNMPAPLLLLTLPGHIAFSVAILGRGLMTGRFAQTLRGMRAGIAGMYELRRSNSEARKASTTGWRTLAASMAWNPIRMLTRRTHVRPLSSLHSSKP